MLRAGTPALPIADEATPSDVQWVDICSWRGDTRLRPSPVVMCLEVDGLAAQQASEGGLTPDVPGMLDIRASPPPFNFNAAGYVGNHGMALVEYSCWGRVSRRWIDIRSGSYQLPPCHAVSVAVRAYNTSPVQNPATWTVGASVAPGRISAPRQAVYSGQVAYDGGGFTGSFPLPPGTSGVRVGVQAPFSNTEGFVFVNGTQPQLVIGPENGYQPAIGDLVPLAPTVGINCDGDEELLVTVEALIEW